MSDKICQHCMKRKVNRPRGLCWGCWYTPGVRDLYPSTSKFARQGVGVTAPLAGATRPTAAHPGTPEKLEVLEARAGRGEALWHAGDSGGDLS